MWLHGFEFLEIFPDIKGLASTGNGIGLKFLRENFAGRYHFHEN